MIGTPLNLPAAYDNNKCYYTLLLGKRNVCQHSIFLLILLFFKGAWRVHNKSNTC